LYGSEKTIFSLSRPDTILTVISMAVKTANLFHLNPRIFTNYLVITTDKGRSAKAKTIPTTCIASGFSIKRIKTPQIFMPIKLDKGYHFY